MAHIMPGVRFSRMISTKPEINDQMIYNLFLFSIVDNHEIPVYCLISLTLPVDICLYMGFLIAWRIVCSGVSPGEL